MKKSFFCEFVLTYIFKLKKANEDIVEKGFDHAILVDEAHNIFLKEKTNFVKESVTDMIYREMREYGTSLICLDQHISKLSDTVKGNSACHIAFQQQLPEDIRDISGIMQLYERKEYFSKLFVGSAIVKLAERYTSPFLIEVEDVELRGQRIKNNEIKKRMESVIMQSEVEKGRDDEFKEKIEMPPEEYRMDDMEKQRERELEIKEIKDREGWPGVEEFEKPSVPDHALYNEEINKVKNVHIKQAREKQEKRIKRKNVNPIFYPTGLTPIQERLLEFVEQQLSLGKSMAEIERIMEYYPNEGIYSYEDVSKVMNYVLANRFNKIRLGQEFNPESDGVPKNVTTKKKQLKQKVYKGKMPSKTINNILKDTTEQERFLTFLQAHPKHNLSSVEVYKKVGLSARKGTKVKDQLLSLGKIQVLEKRNKKGWKKIIQLA